MRARPPSRSAIQRLPKERRSVFREAQKLADTWAHVEGKIQSPWTPSSAWDEVRVLAARRGFDDLTGVSTLAYRGLGHQALVLARSAMELAITVDYISQDPVARAPAYVDWMQVFFARMSRAGTLDAEFARLGFDPKMDLERYAEELARKHRRDLQAHRWTSAKIEVMAEAVNLKDWYERDYAIFSEVAHGARLGLTDAPESFSLGALDQTNQAFSVLISHMAETMGMNVDADVKRIRALAFQEQLKASERQLRNESGA
jgi:hypothetical protein